ncbi:MAG: marR5 [Paenibacillus sp.]|jgi:DNA-binding MarR family transcriptional regulator|nr:marR5 [Paenibacillus sp.]
MVNYNYKEGAVMRERELLLEHFVENFMLLMPLLKRKIFDPLPKCDMPQIQLSGSSVHIIVLLREVRRSIVSELSEKLNISRPNMTPLLDRLEKQGLITRLPCLNDRRSVYVEITEAGDQVCAEYHRIISDRIKSMLNLLDENELMELNEHMSRMKSILIQAGDRTGS